MLFYSFRASPSHSYYKALASLTILAHCVKDSYKDTFSLSVVVSYKIDGASWPNIKKGPDLDICCWLCLFCFLEGGLVSMCHD